MGRGWVGVGLQSICKKTEMYLGVRCRDRCGYEAHVRQTLGHPDFLKNPQKTLFGSFSDAGKKPSKNPKKTLRRPQKF